MPRHPRPAELSLHGNSGLDNAVQPGPNSSPMNLEGVDLGSFGGGFEHDVASGLTPLPPLPQSPPASPRIFQRRDPPKSMLSNFKNKVSPDVDQKQPKETNAVGNEDDEYRPGTSSMSKIYHLRKNPGSTPELSLVGSNESIHGDRADGDKPPLPGPRQHPTLHRVEDSIGSTKKEKTFRPFGASRAKSISRRDLDTKAKPRLNSDNTFDQVPPNTAPLQSDWPGSEMRLNKVKDRRGKSAERPLPSESEETLTSSTKSNQPKATGLQAQSKKFGKGIKSETRGIFSRLGKIGRSSSSNEKEISDSDYQCKIINQGLVDQTRITRISKDLSRCRDKTEYWMPSLPWRCIDYLNAHCEEEGLYRIPGSGPKVKHWQRRFDTERDIDLLSEEIPDTNEITSMLKAWLRDLPTEIMPKEIQLSLASALEQENPLYKNVGQTASQLIRDALSELPPFNYYLLFAITCHLSLLLTNKDKNKMDLNNLSICVGPCLNIERWLFNYLVGDWRHCWQGCYTEKEHLRLEEAFERGESPPSDAKASSSARLATNIDDSRSEAVSFTSATDDRTMSSGSGSAISKPTTTSNDGTRSRSRESERRKGENGPSTTYLPSGHKMLPNGASGLGIQQELRRPHTADQRNGPAPDEGLRGAVPAISTNSSSHPQSRANSTTPRVGHARSRSDLPASPVITNANEFTFPVRPSA